MSNCSGVINKQSTIKCLTHAGQFHCDEITAIAILKLYYKERIFFIVRNSKIYGYGGFDYVIDIGQMFDNEKYFDHHQSNFYAGRKLNGIFIPYSSCGLLWNKFGMSICGNNEYIFNKVYRLFIAGIDAHDNGIIDNAIPLFSISQIVSQFNPIEKADQKNCEKAFYDAIDFVYRILSNLIEKLKKEDSEKILIKKYLEDYENLDYIILKKNISWGSTLINESTKKFVIFEGSNGNWSIKAVPERFGKNTVRKPFPKSWGGASKEELREITGIKTILFCHKNLFVCVTETKEDAISVVELALKH